MWELDIHINIINYQKRYTRSNLTQSVLTCECFYLCRYNKAYRIEGLAIQNDTED